MPLVPHCLATTLHIVPYRDPVQACDLMLRYFPQAPSVPRLSLSVRMYMDGMPCLVIDRQKRRLLFDLSRTAELEDFYQHYLDDDLDYFAMDPKHAAGFYRLLEVIKESPPPELRLLHLELPGPLTWGLGLPSQESGEPAWYEPTMRDVLVKTLIMKARWQEAQVQEALPGVTTMVTLGEPSLGMMETAFGAISVSQVVDTLEEILAAVKGLSCIHCCANLDWSLLLSTSVGAINFDAFKYADKFCLYGPRIEKFLQRGGIIAWGIVPVDSETLAVVSAPELSGRLQAAWSNLSAQGMDLGLIRRQAIITPCCTPSTLTPDDAELAWRLTGQVAQAACEDRKG